MSASSPAIAIPLFRAGMHGTRGPSIEETRRRVRERANEYEDGGSERRSLGAISVPGGAWWAGTLVAPTSDAGSDGDVVFLRFQRHGERPAGYLGETQMDLSVPRSELGAVVRLVTGLVDQARQDGVIGSDTP